MNFKIEKKLEGTLARAGTMETRHGKIETPAYIAPATKAALKALSNEDARSVSTQAMMMNTYHLMLAPGADLVSRAGGLHKFSGWEGPIMTDSGGFQAFSLGEALGRNISKFTGVALEPQGESLDTPKTLLGAQSQNLKPAKFDDDGVTFFSHIDGSEHRITPESSIEIQHLLGADIILAFDECVSPNAPRDVHERAVERTRLWAERCLSRHRELQAGNPLLAPSDKVTQSRALGRPPFAQALFGIVQGGRYEDLRRKSARDIASLDFAGFGIGGSFVKEDMGTAVRWVCEELPEGKPRHLLGVGEPADLFAGVENGIDTFDCVSSTRRFVVYK